MRKRCSDSDDGASNKKQKQVNKKKNKNKKKIKSAKNKDETTSSKRILVQKVSTSCKTKHFAKHEQCVGCLQKKRCSCNAFGTN